MKQIAFSISFLFIFKVSAVPLTQALTQKLVNVKTYYNSSSIARLSLEVKNLTNQTLTIEVPAGYYFQCSDDKAQNMLAMANYSFRLGPSQKEKKELYVHCMEKFDYGPYDQTPFTVMGYASDKLVTLANHVSKNESYRGGLSQELVWCLAGFSQEFHYTKADSIAFWPLLKTVGNNLRLVKDSARYHNFRPIPRIIYNSRVNISTYVAPNAQLTLQSIDEKGKLMHEFYRNKPVPEGFYLVTVGYNDTPKDSSFTVHYILKDAKGNTLLKKKGSNNLMEPEEKVFWLNTSCEMNIEKPLSNASLKLFAPDGKLMLVLYEKRNLTAAVRRTPFGFYHTYGPNAVFSIRLEDQTGKTVQEVKIDAKASEQRNAKSVTHTY